MRNTLATGARAAVVNVNGNSISQLVLYGVSMVVCGALAAGLTALFGWGKDAIMNLLPIVALVGAVGGLFLANLIISWK
jgi:hypothetical protein